MTAPVVGRRRTSRRCVSVSTAARLLVAHQVRRLGRDEEVGAPQTLRASGRLDEQTRQNEAVERFAEDMAVVRDPVNAIDDHTVFGQRRASLGGRIEHGERRSKPVLSAAKALGLVELSLLRDRAGERKRAARVGACAVLENVSGGAPARFGEVGSRRTARCWGERRGWRRSGRPDDRGLPRGGVCRLGSPRTDRSVSDPRVVRRPVAWSGWRGSVLRRVWHGLRSEPNDLAQQHRFRRALRRVPNRFHQRADG